MQRQVSAIAALVLVLAVLSAASAQTERLSNVEGLRGVSGWYAAKGDRHLTILRNENDVVAVFFWGDGAPTSVGRLSKTDDGLVFEQPVGTEAIAIEREGNQVRAITVVDVRFTKSCGIPRAIGRYVGKKNQTMTISRRDNQLYCTIDWGNKAPLTNGWIRADASGKTMLKGYKWQHSMDIQFEGGSIRSITLVGERFDRS